MKAILELEAFGYTLDLDGDDILCAHDGRPSDPATVRGLLAELRAHRPEAVAFLRDRGAVNPFAHPPVPADPRPDLVADSAAWVRLLRCAWPIDGDDPSGLYGALAGLRCCGAALVPDDYGRWRLTPGQMNQVEYNQDRARYLLPHADTLRQLLAALGVRPSGRTS